MVETSYRIVQCEDGGFAIEVIRFGALPQTAAGFATEADAQGWIAQDKRLWESANPSQTNVGRKKWRGT
jgi:hypothetical protein